MEHVVDDAVKLLQLAERGVEHFFQEFLDDTLVVTRVRLQIRKGPLPLFRHQPSEIGQEIGQGRDEDGGGRVTVDGGESVGFERSEGGVRKPSLLVQSRRKSQGRRHTPLNLAFAPVGRGVTTP
ncbi:hypothetical protein ABZ434_33740 [Streptomyces sp. NPDC005761]|uniref:hypothetical protein n=1 Tax=Streptomyces sp. NPDC005761 TaxID=3157066 RepID=UPI0033D332BD